MPRPARSRSPGSGPRARCCGPMSTTRWRARRRVGDDGRWSMDLADVAEGRLHAAGSTSSARTAGWRAASRRRSSATSRVRRCRGRGRRDRPTSPGAVTVQPGHNLWTLARLHYGSGVLYTQIFTANRELIRDPDLIYPGQIFDLPGAGRDRVAQPAMPGPRPPGPAACAPCAGSRRSSGRRTTPTAGARVAAALLALLARQAGDGGDAGAVQGGGRRAGAGRRGVARLVPGGRAGGADARLRRDALRRRRLHPAPRRHLRPRRAAGAAADGDRDLPARARARAALPSRPADRRAQPDHRPRRQGRRRAAALPAVLGRADAARARAGGGDPLGGVRRLVPRRRGARPSRSTPGSPSG